jgi:glutaredoxin 3
MEPGIGSVPIVPAVKDVIVYTADPCRRCLTAKALLEARGVAYTEVNLTKDPDGRAELVRRTGLMTFPQIVIDGEPLGGLDDLQAADGDGRLGGLLAA